MTGLSRLGRAIRLGDSTQPFDRLVKFNWGGQFIFMFALMLASFLVAGFWYPYWRVADMDFPIVYNALLLNDHLPQEMFDHPGYLPILLLSYWLRALHGIGLIRVDALSGLPPVSDVPAFSAVWTTLTQAGRVLSLLLAMGLVTAFTYLLRALTRDWRIAALGGFLFAFSGGMAMQMRTMRTELLSAGLCTIAVLMLLVLARRGPWPWRPAVVGIASALFALAMQSKVQALFLICALPVLLLPFGPTQVKQSPHGFWRKPRMAWPALAAAAAIALVTAYLAKDIITIGLTAANAGVPLKSLGISAATYWAALAVWLALGMIAYCDRVAGRRSRGADCHVRGHCRLHDRLTGARHSLPGQRCDRCAPPPGNDVCVGSCRQSRTVRRPVAIQCRKRPISAASDRRRDRAAYLRPAIFAASDHLPRMVRHRGVHRRSPPARMASRRPR